MLTAGKESTTGVGGGAHDKHVLQPPPPPVRNPSTAFAFGDNRAVLSIAREEIPSLAQSDPSSKKRTVGVVVVTHWNARSTGPTR